MCHRRIKNNLIVSISHIYESYAINSIQLLQDKENRESRRKSDILKTSILSLKSSSQGHFLGSSNSSKYH